MLYNYNSSTDTLLIGIRGVYQGLTPTILKQGTNQAMRFFVMETLKDKYRGGDPNVKVPTLLTGLFGAIAGAVSVFGNTPIDVIKTRMQVSFGIVLFNSAHFYQYLVITA